MRHPITDSAFFFHRSASSMGCTWLLKNLCNALSCLLSFFRSTSLLVDWNCKGCQRFGGFTSTFNFKTGWNNLWQMVHLDPSWNDRWSTFSQLLGNDMSRRWCVWWARCQRSLFGLWWCLRVRCPDVDLVLILLSMLHILLHHNDFLPPVLFIPVVLALVIPAMPSFWDRWFHRCCFGWLLTLGMNIWLPFICCRWSTIWLIHLSLTAVAL